MSFSAFPKRRRAIIALAAILPTLASLAFGGVDEAKKYIESAKHDVEIHSFYDVPNNLELAEVELEDVPDAVKKPLLAQIAELRKIMAGEQGELKLKNLVRTLDNLLNDAKPQIGNAMFPPIADQIDELLADKDNRAALGAEVEKYTKQLATFRKLHTRRFSEEQITIGQSEIPELKTFFDETMKEITNPETSSYAKESLIDKLQRKFDEWEAWWPLVPAADPRVVEMKKIVTALQTKFTEVALADRVKEVAETLKRAWESYKDDWDGYAAETTGPSWDEYRSHTGNEKIDNFGAPKSNELVERYESFLANRVEDENYQAVKDAPAIRAYMESLAKIAESCRARVVTNATTVVASAEKAAITADNRDNFDRLEDRLRVLFVNQTGAQDGAAQALHERLVKKIRAFEDATQGAAKAREAWYAAMTKSAAKNWDEVAGKFSATSGFDPNNARAAKGKIIRFETDNLMGWRFKPGDFPFASTLGGIPIAARYSADVKRAIEQIETKLGRSLGDDDNDGRWTIIARVTGTYGRMMQKKQAEGDIVEKGTGSKVGSFTIDYADPVDAAIIEIIAARCGPLCVGEDVGMAREDGTLGSP